MPFIVPVSYLMYKVRQSHYMRHRRASQLCSVLMCRFASYVAAVPALVLVGNG